MTRDCCWICRNSSPANSTAPQPLLHADSLEPPVLRFRRRFCAILIQAPEKESPHVGGHPYRQHEETVASAIAVQGLNTSEVNSLSQSSFSLRARVLNVERGDDDLLFVDVLSRNFLDDLAFEDYEYSVAVVDELLVVTGIEQHGRAFGC